MKIEEKLEE
jgi:hypothetical protein